MKIALSLLLLLLGQIVHCQQSVEFDLNTGKFNKKLSYIEHIVIEGAPLKGGTKISIIELVVTTKNKSFDKSISKKEVELGQTTVHISSLESQISNNDIANEYSKDYKDKLKELEKERSSGGAGVAALEADVKALEDASKKLHETQKKMAELKRSTLVKEISDLKQKAKKNTEFDRIVWENDGDEKKFKLELGKTLSMTESYDFQFKLYTHKQLPFPVNAVTKVLVEEIADRIDNNHFVAQANIDPLVEKYLDSIAAEYFDSKMVYDKGKQTLTPISASSLQNKTAIKAAFVALASPYSNLKNNQTNLERITTSLMNDIVVLANGVNLMNDPVAKDRLQHLFNSYDAANKPQFDALIASFNIDAVQATAVWSRAGTLGINLLNMDIARKQATVDAQFAILNGLIDPQIKSLYLKEFDLSHSTVATAEDTKLDATRIGTHYGVGAIFLDNYFEAIELTQFVSLNIRWGAYDNRLPGKEAFKSVLSRFSFVFGMGTTSNLEYKGQKLANTRIGFKPMLGLSFQPVKHMDVSLTTFVFTQESISSEQSYSLTKFRPMLSIAFDFNAVNYLINKNK